jgi:Tfp pilus assembly protein FimT
MSKRRKAERQAALRQLARTEAVAAQLAREAAHLRATLHGLAIWAQWGAEANLEMDDGWGDEAAAALDLLRDEGLLR